MADRSANRAGHASGLVGELNDAQVSVAGERQALPSEDRSQGFAIHIQADAGLELKLESLNNSGLSLLAVRPPSQGSPQEAVVWVPDDSVQKLAKKINDFTSDTRHGNPRNAQLVANMKHIERAVLANLWMEADPFPDPDEYRWWELWFDPRTAQGDQVQTLRHVAEAHSWVMAPRSVNIGDFRVAQVAATARDLAAVMATGACPAEIRQPSFVEALLGDQRELQPGFVADLVERLRHAQPGAPTVCLLDTGVHQEHPLLRGALVNVHNEMVPEGIQDRQGHGTWMAGVSLFGDGLSNALESQNPIVLVHGLESVKILSLSPADPPRVFGEVTATAMSRVETSSGAPPRARVFAMAVTVPSTSQRNGTDGRATLWSTTIDALAAGTDVEARADGVALIGAPDSQSARLIIVSAGNVVDHPVAGMRGIDGSLSHLALCDTSRIEDPAHAWNVLTVGASTHLVDVPQHRDFTGYRPLASAGELSPFSRTSVAMPEATAIKPDIVLEGGNLLVDAEETHTYAHDLVSVMTTGRPIADRVLTSINATSAATAQAAHLAALAFAAYPQARPETVRGLLVHEAQWTENMTEGVYARTMRRKMTSGEFARKVLRRYGWGMPTEERVLSSAANAVTMMIQGTLVPFIRSGNSIRLGELNLHQLPWPREQLLELGTAPVQLRVTLSYFIEPNPGRKGVLGTHTYASHRLRFALKAPHQSLADFEHRVALAAEAENDGITSVAAFESDKNWVVGSDNRNRGSLHADLWHGTATELADCGALAIYPAGGWWKYNNRSDRVGTPVHYALLVSLATPEVTADLYTPTAVMLNVPVTVEPAARNDGVSIASQLPLEW